jgi:ribosomal protein S12 methylthiotransferase accessory factor
LDLTTDLQIPSFAAVSGRTDKPVEDILVAFGAHLDPRIGVRRAITELNQFLPAVLQMASDGSGEYAFPDPESQEWWRNATIRNQPYLLPDATQMARRLSDYPIYCGDDLHDDIEICRSIVERLGMQMLVLNQTRPDVGLPTVKVLVPGMRHFWARFAPGRLYDVPPKLGWLPEGIPEELLNPIPVFV